jgi:glycogen phosphorylase
MTDSVTVQRFVEDDRTGLSIETLRRAMADNLYYVQGKFPGIATGNDYYMALAYTVRDRLLQRWISTIEKYRKNDVRIVGYLSAEFLLGPHLANNLVNLDIYDRVKTAVEESGLDLDELVELEEEPGLGNGGLGRLAACYMDSLASLEIPAVGYGIRYEFGIFDQEIRDGWQVEITDKWLNIGNPWEIRRSEITFQVKLGGHSEGYTDDQNRYRVRWIPHRVVNGVAYDTPILGYKVNTANTLRLWKAEATESFDFQAFNVGNYIGAVQEKVFSENITKVLYPNDDSWEGKELRLEQQYFFVSCSLQDIIRLHLIEGDSVDNLHDKFTLQLNDTHPSIGVAELMRLLIDDYGLEWEKAWFITTHTFAYTNHTILPEALERWSIPLFKSLLPRHLEIIYEINSRFLADIRAKFPNDDGLISRLSIIDESGDKYVRMAHLATVGSYAVNGVAALHTELLEKYVLHDFFKLWPEKFSNKTNGVTPRRWLLLSNPPLSELITGKIGTKWIKQLDELKKLEKFADDKAFRLEWQEAKLATKVTLSNYVKNTIGITMNPESIFDIHVKRIHEYKRQLLNALRIVAMYNRVKNNEKIAITPRTFIFGGKAAPGYFMAKLIIKLINSIGDIVNRDKDVKDLLKVVYLPDYNVKFGQRVYPAADVSEQISTAGKEASGTSNMKFSMNGALTVGTLDGANIEIREEVGAENFFLFGLNTDEVLALKTKGYNPYDYYNSNAELKQVIDQIQSGYFSFGDKELFRPIVDSLMHSDEYMLFADFQSYLDCQDRVDAAYKDQDQWAKMSILNVARMGKFSSDRSIREYCQEIWKAEPVEIEMKDYDQGAAGLSVPRSPGAPGSSNLSSNEPQI